MITTGPFDNMTAYEGVLILISFATVIYMSVTIYRNAQHARTAANNNTTECSPQTTKHRNNRIFTHIVLWLLAIFVFGANVIAGLIPARSLLVSGPNVAHLIDLRNYLSGVTSVLVFVLSIVRDAVRDD